MENNYVKKMLILITFSYESFSTSVMIPRLYESYILIKGYNSLQ